MTLSLGSRHWRFVTRFLFSTSTRHDSNMLWLMGRLWIGSEGKILSSGVPSTSSVNKQHITVMNPIQHVSTWNCVSITIHLYLLRLPNSKDIFKTELHTGTARLATQMTTSDTGTVSTVRTDGRTDGRTVRPGRIAHPQIDTQMDRVTARQTNWHTMAFDLHKKCQEIMMTESKSNPISGTQRREICGLHRSSDLLYLLRAAESFLRI